MQVRAKEKAFTFTYLFDDGQNLSSIRRYKNASCFCAEQKKKGKNVVRYIGAIDNNYADAADVSPNANSRRLPWMHCLLAKK